MASHLLNSAVPKISAYPPKQNKKRIQKVSALKHTSNVMLNISTHVSDAAGTGEKRITSSSLLKYYTPKTPTKSSFFIMQEI